MTDYLAQAREAVEDAHKAHNPGDQVTFAARAQALATVALAEALTRVADALEHADDPVPFVPVLSAEVFDLPGRVHLAVPEEPHSPDCRQGKHTACSGDAWDDEHDQLTPCVCECHPTPEAAAGGEPR